MGKLGVGVAVDMPPFKELPSDDRLGCFSHGGKKRCSPRWWDDRDEVGQGLGLLELARAVDLLKHRFGISGTRPYNFGSEASTFKAARPVLRRGIVARPNGLDCERNER